MFEHRKQPLLPRGVFYTRLARSLSVASTIVLVSLALGMAGYHFLEHLPWLDAYVNAAMILSGMGPVSPIQTSVGKLFAGCYALFSGLAFITALGVVFAPVFHRFLHKFHMETEGGAGGHRDRIGPGPFQIPAAPKGLNPKPEAQNPKETRNPSSEIDR